MITNNKNLSAAAFLLVCITATQFVKIRGIRVTGFRYFCSAVPCSILV